MVNKINGVNGKEQINKEIENAANGKNCSTISINCKEFIQSPIYNRLTERLDILVGISTKIKGIKPRQALMFSTKVDVMKEHYLTNNFKGIEKDFYEKIKELKSIPEKSINNYLAVSLEELEKLDQDYLDKINEYGEGGVIPLTEPLASYRYIENLIMTVDILALINENQEEIKKGLNNQEPM